jgi:hypothetical protein
MAELGDERLAERFWDKVRVNPETGCWEWTAHLIRNGYGHFRWQGKMRRAHRLAYEALVGEIPEGFQLDHLCRTRNCVNPDHVEPVTPQENTLRGDTIAARHAAKTHCPQGHPYDEENTFIRKGRGGGRGCRTCRRARTAQYDAKRRGKAA